MNFEVHRRLPKLTETQGLLELDLSDSEKSCVRAIHLEELGGCSEAKTYGKYNVCVHVGNLDDLSKKR